MQTDKARDEAGQANRANRSHAKTESTGHTGPGERHAKLLVTPESPARALATSRSDTPVDELDFPGSLGRSDSVSVRGPNGMAGAATATGKAVRPAIALRADSRRRRPARWP